MVPLASRKWTELDSRRRPPAHTSNKASKVEVGRAERMSSPAHWKLWPTGLQFGPFQSMTDSEGGKLGTCAILTRSWGDQV
eukprot:1159087-Pelagomonas_calceolata.AAC.9